MAARNPQRTIDAARWRIATLREDLARFDYVCSGTLLRRMMKCGKATCRCQDDPAARHGPYYDWTRRVQGRFVHKMLSPEQADTVRKAIENYRAILGLLRAWERETTRVIEAADVRK